MLGSLLHSLLRERVPGVYACLHEVFIDNPLCKGVFERRASVHFDMKGRFGSGFRGLGFSLKATKA